jgi:hypothetical protein
MRTGIQILFLILFFSSCLDNPVKTEEEKEREMVLQNKISSIRIFKTDVHLSIKENEELNQERTYNEKGYLIRVVDYADKNIIDFVYDYKYDEKNNLTIITGTDKDGNLTSKVVRSYNNQNKLHELYYYLPDGTYKYRNIRSYDKDGRVSELSWYWTTGFKSKNVYAYQGWNKISDTEFDASGHKTYEWRFNYDKRGNVIEAAQYYPGEILTNKTTYEYNNSNKLAKQTNYQGTSLTHSIQFKYNNNLLSVKTEYSPSGRPTAIYRYEYKSH